MNSLVLNPLTSVNYTNELLDEYIIEPVKLTPNGRTVLEMRYLQPNETPEQRFWSVAMHVAKAEDRFKGEHSLGQLAWAKTFYDRMANLEFLPNSPTLRNAGAPHGGCLSGCFVVPIDDSMEGILSAHNQAAWIMKYGGGVGFDFSELRPRDTPIRSTQKGACGPVAVMRMMNQLSDTFTQGAGAFRVGAQMFILRVDHPDIEEFIDCKNDGVSITHANVSVAVTKEFMEALDGDGLGVSGNLYELKHKNKVIGLANAKEIWLKIASSAWKTGDPGLWFVDRANGLNNPLRHYTKIASTNPCGEQALEPYGSCNLGSVDVSKFVAKYPEWDQEFDWSRLSACIGDAVRFLDDVVEINDLPTKETNAANKKSRRIGLGIMGWADALVKLKIPYDSEEALNLAGRMMQTVKIAADWMSLKLGRERGEYEGWIGGEHANDGLHYRNSFRLTMAPTGTISLIAGCSSGIEPHFALSWDRTAEDGTVLKEIHPAYEEWLKEFIDAPVHQRPQPPSHFRTAMDITPEWHIRHQATFQRYVDNSISKTINLSESATIEDVMDAYRMAYDLGCKGITIYRDKCRDIQVLNVAQPLHQFMCPECQGELDQQEGCVLCPKCGWSACSL